MDDTDLMGRQDLRSLLRDALDRALGEGPGDSVGTAVLLRGEAGVGKTALLGWMAAEARGRGCLVLRVSGAESEEKLAFGALHQVFGPLLRQLPDALAPHQRQTLESALGLRDARPQGDFLIGAAALTLLAAAARKRPVVMLLDDVQWMDPSSAAVLGFLHRRLSGLPVLIVSGGRPRGAATDGWTARWVDVPPLCPDEAAALLRRHHPGLAPPAQQRVLAQADGNPLALVELPRHRIGDPLDATAAWETAADPGHRLERLFDQRFRRLPPAALRVLLLVALGGEAAAWNATVWLWREAGAGGAAGDAAWDGTEGVLDAIESSGLAHLDSTGRLCFRHPLVRSAVISRASREELRRAHIDLARSLGHDDPRRLLHEAAAARATDEDLAVRLEAAGQRVAGRGGDAEGAVLLDRAAALSGDARSRAGRLARAATMAARGGRLQHAARLVEAVRGQPVPPEVAPLAAFAQVYVDQSHLVDFESSFTLLPRILSDLESAGEDACPGLAEQAYFKLVLATAYTDDPRGRVALERHRSAASPLARLCHQAWVDPARTAHGVADRLHELVAGMGAREEAGAAWLVLWTAAAVDVADARLWRRFAEQHAYATQGTIAKARSYQHYLKGRWDQAEACLREAEAADELGYHSNALLFRHYYAHFLAGRGDEEGLRAVDASVRPVASRAGMTFVEGNLDRLAGLVALAHGRSEEAYRRLAVLTPPGVLPRGTASFHLALFDFVEAAVQTGRLAEARAHMAAARSARMAEISPHHALLFAAAAAMAAPDEEADALFQAACGVPGAEEWMFPMARLRLAHGSRLRLRRAAQARDVLLTALHTFRSLGAVPWVARAERELRAAGTSAGLPAGGAEVLTAQQLRIARLAADGLTNKEIGEVLRVSSRTVSDHLYRIYPKLGITSRAALARVLGAAGQK
ncbi:AAA family ATPase [Streptomyces sp. NPDC048297]|uniref:helix-turn-helix transcriptional regulator n=1 Tax=Streptomyces sp. NPDC048297 TaxID=3365531 RepID=UPI003723ED96